MKTMDLSGLIKGLMVVIGIALIFGKLDLLKHWAITGLSMNQGAAYKLRQFH